MARSTWRECISRRAATDDAATALQRAAERHPEFRPWTRAWLTALVDRENGHLDEAVNTLRSLLETRFAEARERGFDFAKDFRARNMLGRTLYEQARRERGAVARGTASCLAGGGSQRVCTGPDPGSGEPHRPLQPGADLRRARRGGARRGTSRAGREVPTRRPRGRACGGDAPAQQLRRQSCRRAGCDLRVCIAPAHTG